MLKGLAVTLVVAGLSLLAVAGHEVAATRRHQAVEQRQLESALLASRPSPSAVPGRAAGSRSRAAGGDAWGRLQIDRLGLSVVLDEGVDSATLRRSVGHLPGTPFPGEEGNVVLAGHRDGLFRPLRGAKAGDRLRITTPDGVFDYEVTSLDVVEPERTDVLASGGAPEVTLVTCYPFAYVGPAPQRYIVKARAVPQRTASGSGTAR